MNRLSITAMFLLVLVGIGWQSCINPDDFPPEPEISNAGISDSIIRAGVDSLVISFDFQDGNGDLGNKKNDTITNIFLIDNRTGFEYNYQMPVIGNREQSVTGTVWVTIDPFNITCRPFNDGRDTISYDIFVIDRADSVSNVITTPEVILICQ